MSRGTAAFARFLQASATLALAGCLGLVACTQPRRDAAKPGSEPASRTAPAAPAPPRLLARADRGVATAQELSGTDVLAAVRARFVAFGDSGTGDRDQDAIAAMMRDTCQRLGCDFAVHLGDIIYPRGVLSPDDPVLHARFEVPYGPLGIPVYLSLGNHDYYGDPDAAVAYTLKSPSKRWILPARHHTFMQGGVRFVALDTNKPDKAQAAWVRTVLAESRRAREPWVIAFGHHPRQSFGAHGHADEQLADWLDRTLCYRVDLYLAGHDHDKQILKPRCGLHQVISGAAAQLRPVKSGPQTVFARSTLGVAWLEATGSTLQMRFLDRNGRVEVEQVWTRARTDRCAADAVCDGTCPSDPDCVGVDCTADGRCNEACTDDADCTAPGACGCDRGPLACEVRERDGTLPCACDAACQVGRPPCIEDGACDDQCRVGSDMDCRP